MKLITAFVHHVRTPGVVGGPVDAVWLRVLRGQAGEPAHEHRAARRVVGRLAERAAGELREQRCGRHGPVAVAAPGRIAEMLKPCRHVRRGR